METRQPTKTIINWEIMGISIEIIVDVDGSITVNGSSVDQVVESVAVQDKGTSK